jgi:hypothetical protein
MRSNSGIFVRGGTINTASFTFSNKRKSHSFMSGDCGAGRLARALNGLYFDRAIGESLACGWDLYYCASHLKVLDSSDVLMCQVVCRYVTLFDKALTLLIYLLLYIFRAVVYVKQMCSS